MYAEMIVIIDNSKDVFLCTYDIDENTGEYKTKAINSENTEIYTEYDLIEALDNYDDDGNAWFENVIKVEKDGKYGLIDIDGKEISNIEYDEIEVLQGIENSILITQDGKKGLINSSGVTVINAEYSDILAYGDDYKDGYITIDEDGNYGLVSYTGTQILENNYEEIVQVVGTSYFVIKEDGEEKLINESGETILDEGYSSITQINTDGIIFEKDEKYGFMGYDGEIKIKTEYDKLEQINTGVLKAKKDENYGLIDLTGEELVEFEYTDVYYNENAGIYVAEDSDYTSYIMNSDFEIEISGILSELNTDDGYIKIKTDGEYKYYNFKFEEKEITDILETNTLFVSKQDDKYGYVDIDGNVVVDYIYDEALEQNDYGYAAVKQDDLWGAIDSYGNVVIEPTYDLEENLVIDFIGQWHLGQDINMNYYCEK